MSQKLDDKIVKALPAPASGNKVYYDSDVTGFGCRVTKGGARSFILNYRTRAGRERRYTIGEFPSWKTGPARAEASEWKRRVRNGEDPLADLEAERAAPTVGDLCTRFAEEHLPKKRPSTQRDYQSAIDRHILPELKYLKVADVSYSDVDALHRKITRRGTPYHANRVLALLSKMFSQAIRWGWRADNPAKGIERNQEHKRQRYLSADELGRLTLALAEHDDQQAANIIRLLLLTGARRGEVLAARWDQLDLKTGTWIKPGATTKQRTEHRVPLSAPARQLLREIWEAAALDQDYVFPGRHGKGHRINVKADWAGLCKAAGIAGARIHDLRHTYASILAGAGMSLPLIGALLGHTQPATTARYAHLLDDPLRQATERVGAVLSGNPDTNIVPMNHHRSG
jgi:integrase